MRFELGAYWFNPSIRIIAPWREWDFKSRSELLAFAEAQKIPVEATASKPYSIDRNLLHTSYEGGILEDPDAEPPAEMFQRTADPRRAPDEPREVRSRSRRGRRWPSTARRWGRRRCSPSSTPSPARTASAAPTSSRTASSA